MTKKVTSIVLVSALVLTIGIFAFAAPQQGGGMRHAGFGMNMAERFFIRAEMLLRMKDQLGLTPDQVAKIEKMNDQFSEASIKLHANIQIAEIKLKNILSKDNVDRKAAENMIRDIAKMKTDAQVDRINFMLDVKSILTPDQVKKIQELRMNRMRDVRDKIRDKIRDKMRDRKGGQGPNAMTPPPPPDEDPKDVM